MGRPPTTADLSTKPFLGGAPVILPSGEIPSPMGFVSGGFGGIQIPSGIGVEIGQTIGEIIEQNTGLQTTTPTAPGTVISQAVGGTAGCWVVSGNDRTNRMRMRRRRLKIAGYDANGQAVYTAVCAPRHMNPLNPRALKRAAVRLGRFQSIATGIEKMIAKACKVKPRRMGPRLSCAPKRCR